MGVKLEGIKEIGTTLDRATIVEGNFIDLIKNNYFDVVVYSRNCLRKSGYLRQDFDFNKEFNFNSFHSESLELKDEVNKLGSIIYAKYTKNDHDFDIVLAYDHYYTGRPFNIDTKKPLINQSVLDYDAFSICLKKISLLYNNPTIGFSYDNFIALRADMSIVFDIIDTHLPNADVLMIKSESK